MTAFRYRISGKDSPEMMNLWEWSRQFRGDPGWMGADLQVARRHNAIRNEVESTGGRWSQQDHFASTAEERLTFLRMK